MFKKCKCGSDNFFINEDILHKGAIAKDGILEAYKLLDNDISTINCSKCGKEYQKSDFKENGDSLEGSAIFRNSNQLI